MRENIILIKDTGRIKTLLEDTRRSILSLLKIDDMAISQIADALGKDRTTIYRHVKKLEEEGFVEVKGERILHHIPERVYGRTADLFLPLPKSLEPTDYSKGNLEWDKEITSDILKSLNKMGYKNECSEEIIEEIEKTFNELDEDINDLFSENKDEIGDITFFGLLRLKFLIILIEMINNSKLDKRINKILNQIEYHS